MGMSYGKKSPFWSWVRMISGILICLASIVGGLYLGVWVCLIGGVVDVINGVTHDPVQATKMGIGVAKFIFAGFVGWLTFLVGFATGNGLIQSA